MYPVEKRFYNEFKDSMDLVYEPCIRINGVKWYPDFLDTKTGIYYEVVNSLPTFYRHKKQGHFKNTVKCGKRIILAVFIKEISFFVLDEYKIIDPYYCYREYDQKIWYKVYMWGINEGHYKREYGDGTKLF